MTMDEIIFSILWTIMLMLITFVNVNAVSGCCCGRKKKKKEEDDEEGEKKDGAKAGGAAAGGGNAGGEAKAPAKAGMAGTFDPNYQTMAGLGNDVFGADKGGAGGGGGEGGGGAAGGAAPAAPAGEGPKAPAQGGMAGTYDPNYQTMAGLGNDVFGDKGGGGGGAPAGGGGAAPAGGGGAAPPAPKAPEQGGMAGTYDPNYQTLAGVGNDVFDKK